MIKLCETLGGSKAYGLDTLESDSDIRYVFLNTEIFQIVGLGRYDYQDGIKNRNKDLFGFELRHFFNLLKKANTQCLELIWNKNWISCTNEWKEIQNHKNQFTNPNKSYHSLKGYVLHERRLTNGERKGQIGFQRYEQVKKLGYSPKNGVQAIRLLWTGVHLLIHNEYPVNVKEYNPNLWKLLMEIKTSPENFNKDTINEIIDKYEKELDKTYEDNKNRIKDIKFNERLANKLLLTLYYPILNAEYNKQD